MFACMANLIVALRNEKGSYNLSSGEDAALRIVALRNEKGSYNINLQPYLLHAIVALRNEKGSYNQFPEKTF